MRTVAVITASALLASYAERNYIQPQTETVDLAASADESAQSPSTLDTIQAMAVKGFAQVSGPLQYVRATEHFYVAGSPVFVDDFVQVTTEDAKRLINANRAVAATDEEVAAAQKASKK